MKRITRSFLAQEVKKADGSTVFLPNISKKVAQALLSDGDQWVATKSMLYEMSVETFLEHATPVVPK